MTLGSGSFGTSRHFLMGLIEVFGAFEGMVIMGDLQRHAESTRGGKLNKWQMAYLATQISEAYPGFDLFLVGYFGDGDFELTFEDLQQIGSDE